MIHIGTKFYKYEGNAEKADIYRVVGYQNSETVRLRNEQTKEITKVDINTIKNEYVRIAIHGLIIVNVVTVGSGKYDVIFSLTRDKEINAKLSLPYCVCRQGITDIHSQPFTVNSGREYYGACVSVDTIPAGIDFDIMVACEEVHPKETQIVAVYINDTLDSILELIDTTEYDKILNLLFLEHLQHVSQKYGQMYYKAKLETGECEGYCNTLRKLLELNSFMYDFCRGYNIYPLDFDLKDYDKTALPDDYRTILTCILCKNIDKAMVLKYDHDISLNNITKDYALISDVNDDLYVVVYTSSGIYSTEQNLLVDTYSHIRFNKEKYK